MLLHLGRVRVANGFPGRSQLLVGIDEDRAHEVVQRVPARPAGLIVIFESVVVAEGVGGADGPLLGRELVVQLGQHAESAERVSPRTTGDARAQDEEFLTFR